MAWLAFHQVRAPVVRFIPICIAIAILGLCPAVASAQQAAQSQEAEQNTNRNGGDFNSLNVKTQTGGFRGDVVSQCRDACQSDKTCRSWALVKAGVLGPDAKCFLKNTLPPTNHDTNVISGVAIRELEPNTDRFGFDLPSAPGNAKSVAECQSMCVKDKKCAAWVFMPSKSQCFFKNQVPAAFQNNCCTAGVPDKHVVN